jgi:hypothetical protein
MCGRLFSRISDDGLTWYGNGLLSRSRRHTVGRHRNGRCRHQPSISCFDHESVRTPRDADSAYDPSVERLPTNFDTREYDPMSAYRHRDPSYGLRVRNPFEGQCLGLGDNTLRGCAVTLHRRVHQLPHKR